MIERLTATELAGLSEEERAALSAPESDDIDILKEIAAEGETSEGTRTDDEPMVFTPTLHVEDVGDVSAKIAEVRQQHEGLVAKYRDGDMTIEELLAEQNKLSALEVGHRMRAAHADFAARQNNEAVRQRWEHEQTVFLEDHPEYDQKKNPVLWGALNEAVKALALYPGNAHRSGSWFLKEAHAQVHATTRNRVASEDELSSHGREGDTERGAGEFTRLDKLTGLEYEQALARLTPEQQERYLGQT